MQTEKRINIFKLHEVLTLIRETMIAVRDEKKPLDMDAFFGDETAVDETTTIHTCGTAACVAGYSVLNPEIRALIPENIAGLVDLKSRADDLWEWVDKLGTCGFRIGSVLFFEFPEYRTRAFEEAFPDVDPEQFKHLTIEDPTPEDVVRLLDWLLGDQQ